MPPLAPPSPTPIQPTGSIGSTSAGESTDRIFDHDTPLSARLAPLQEEGTTESIGGDERDHDHRSALWAIIVISVCVTCASFSYAIGTGRETNAHSDDGSGSPLSATADMTIPRNVARQFLQTTSTEERIRLVRNPELHQANIRAHSANGGDGKAQGIVSCDSYRAGEELIHSFQVQFADGRERLLCVLENRGRMLIDWEAFARSSTHSWESILDGQATTDQPAEVRVLVEFDPSIGFHYGEEGKRYRGFALTSPDCAATLYGFVERGTHAEQRLVKAVRSNKHGAPGDSRRRMTLLIGSTDGSYSEREFVIQQVLAAGWVRSDGSQR